MQKEKLNCPVEGLYLLQAVMYTAYMQEPLVPVRPHVGAENQTN